MRSPSTSGSHSTPIGAQLMAPSAATVVTIVSMIKFFPVHTSKFSASPFVFRFGSKVRGSLSKVQATGEGRASAMEHRTANHEPGTEREHEPSTEKMEV